MKFPTIIALLSTTVLATITLEDLPSTLRAGSTQIVKWTQDFDYVSPNSSNSIPSYDLTNVHI